MLRRELLKASAVVGAGVGVLGISSLGKKETAKKECNCVCYQDLYYDRFKYVTICPSAFKTPYRDESLRTATIIVSSEFLDVGLPQEIIGKRKSFIESAVKVDSIRHLNEKCACGGVHVAGEFFPITFTPRDNDINNAYIFEKTIKVPVYFPANLL